MRNAGYGIESAVYDTSFPFGVTAVFYPPKADSAVADVRCRPQADIAHHGGEIATPDPIRRQSS